MTSSRFRFLRRVRIHGGECGAVARALHHAVESSSLYQADLGKASISTIERKEMSFKTAIKRLSLSLVVALGLGMTNGLPAGADYNVDNTTWTASAVGRVDVGIEFLVKSNSSSADGFDCDASPACYAHAQLLAAPTFTANATAASAAGLALLNDSVSVSGAAILTNPTSNGVQWRWQIAAGAGDTYVAGTYTWLIWVDTLADKNSTATSPNNPATPNAIQISVTLGAQPTQFALTSSSGSADSSSVTTNLVEFTLKDVNGVETLPTSSDSYGITSYTSSSTAWYRGFVGDTLSTSGVKYGGVIDTRVSQDRWFGWGQGGGEINATHTSKVRFWVGSSHSGTTYFDIKGVAGAVNGISATYTLTTVSYPVVSRITPAGGSAFGGTRVDTSVTSVRDSSYTAFVTNGMVQTDSEGSQTPTAVSLLANLTTGKAVTFQLDLESTGLVRGTVAAQSTTVPVPAGVSVGAFDFTADSTTVARTFTATAPAAGEGYKVTFNMGNNSNTVVYNVTYVAQQLSSTIGAITTNIDTTPRAAIGSTNTITVTAKDGFGALISGATVRLTHNRTALGTTSDVLTTTTDASGVASFTIADVKTVVSATNNQAMQGTFTISASTANATTSASATRYIAYTAAANLTPGSVVITETAEDDDTVGNVVDTVINETITVKTDTGVAMAGIAYTATISDGLYERKTYASGASQLTGFTDANGQAFIRVAGYKSGVQTVTFTVGSLTASDTFTVVSSSGKFRAVSVAATTASVDVDKTGFVTVTAKDVYGNPVPSMSLTVSYVGDNGRIVSYNGAQANSASTDANGELKIGILADKAGTGTLKVESTAGVAATTSTTTQGVAPIVRASSVSVVVTSTGTSATVAAAEAATDAALEAIDAANAATDAANLAAEAADAATVAAEEARDAADAATAAVEALASEVATLIAGLKAQITTLANTVAKIAKKIRA